MWHQWASTIAAAPGRCQLSPRTLDAHRRSVQNRVIWTGATMGDHLTIRELVGFEQIATIYDLTRQGNSHLDEATFRARLTDMLAQGGYRCIAAFDGDRMVGVSGFWVGTQLWCGKYVEPDNVFVDPKLRSRGIGAKLMQWIEAEAERIGCDVMRAAMLLGRDRTRAFYRRSGFADDGLLLVKPVSAFARGAFPEYVMPASGWPD
jgi:GNAT superfamily N-acetyltransferase